MDQNADSIPVVWVPAGDEVVVAARSDRRLAGWTTFFSTDVAGALGRLADGKGGSQVQVRTFSMRGQHLKYWDTAVRKGADGYSYGTVWSEDNKFLKNLQFKEVAPAPGSPASPVVDPAQLAMAAALHQIQRTLDAMDAKLDRIQLTIDWLEARRQSKQSADLLTAAGTLSSVGRRCLVTGKVHPEDLLRISHLEQVVGSVHREICHELRDHSKRLAFTDVKSAKSALEVKAGRVADVVQLSVYALDALRTYHQLMLLSKVNNRRLEPTEVDEACAELLRLASATEEAARHILNVETRMSDRSVLDYMFKAGNWGIAHGRAEDRKLRGKAEAHRALTQRKVKKAGKQLAVFSRSVQSLHTLELANRPELRLATVA